MTRPLDCGCSHLRNERCRKHSPVQFDVRRQHTSWFRDPACWTLLWAFAILVLIAATVGTTVAWLVQADSLTRFIISAGEVLAVVWFCGRKRSVGRGAGR